MSQDWILEEVLKTEEYDDSDPDRLNATVIDSATGDDWHKQKAATVDKKVTTALDDAGYDQQSRNLTFDGPIIMPERVPDAWLNQSLTAPPSIRTLCTDQKLRSWWMGEDREPLSTVNARGFGGGVERRRSVSKALYHISDHVDQSVEPRVSTNDEVAVVAALGGGTGSGMILDIVEDLDCNRAHLYAVIPHDGDKENPKTNAHAALSELEYLQLVDDNPFSTITLIPHIQSLDNREFEMGVVRTMLAHQNAVQGGNFKGDIFPGGNNGPPKYAPFTLAVPYTVRYDIEAREEAESEIERVLEAKRNELQREADLYEVVKKYLRQSFPDSAGAVLDGKPDPQGDLDSEEGGDQALQLRSRIEDDLFGTFLDAVAFEVAGLEDVIDDIQREKKRLYASGAIPNNMDVGGVEEAREYIRSAPGSLWSALDTSDFAYPESETRSELIEVLKLEMENIEDRRDLWRATSVLTSEHTDLDRTDAGRIRTALRDGVLHEQVEALQEKIRDPRLEEWVENLKQDKVRLETRKTELEEFYRTVADELLANFATWRDEKAWESLRTLAAINEHEGTVNDAIEDLEEALEKKASRVANLDTRDGTEKARLALGQIGPLGDMEVEGLAPLNEKLSEMGVPEIQTDPIEQGYRYLIDARQAKIQHDPGLLGTDKSGEFDDAITNLAGNGFFRVNPNYEGDIDIDQTFRASYTGDLSREDQIEERKTEAIKKIRDSFEETFADNGALSEYSHAELSEDLPDGLRVSEIKKEIKSGLEESDAETAQDIILDVFPFDKIDASEPRSEVPEDVEAAAETLFIAYLAPIGNEYDLVVERLGELVDEEDGYVGLIDRVERLEGLSNPEKVNVKIPEAHPQARGGETYGRTFARNHEGIYEVVLERNIETDTNDHPYLSHRTAKPEDLAGGPTDIAESAVLENHEDGIVGEFERSVDRMFGDDERVPLETLEPRGSGNHTDITPEYQRLRFRPVYMSRAFEYEDDSSAPKYDGVHNEVQRNRESLQQNSLYSAESYDSGGPDELTQVMFVGGVFLDNLSLLTKLDGYKDEYESQYGRSDFIGAHHSIGLGRMAKWETLSGWIEEDAADQGLDGDVGGYVYRKEVRDITDGEFVDELMEKDETDGESPEDFLLELYECDAYESTIPLTNE
jgi:hypothetical protein